MIPGGLSHVAFFCLHLAAAALLFQLHLRELFSYNDAFGVSS